MRLGRRTKSSGGSRGWRRAGETSASVTPLHVVAETVIGQVSPDLVSTFFVPKIQQIVAVQMERYAGEMLDYQDSLQQQQSSSLSSPKNKEAEDQMNDAEIESDGSVSSFIVGEQEPPARPLFHSRAVWDDFVQAATETSDHFFSAKSPGWKIQANAAKFERLLDEKYGVFRPFITNHPEIEKFVRSVQRRYALGQFSPIRQGDPPIPRSTAIVILFMMSRGGIRWEYMVLSSAFFLVGLQPWALVALVALGHTLLVRRKHRPVGSMQKLIPAIEPYYAIARAEASPELVTKKKNELLLQTVGTPLPAPSFDDRDSSQSSIDTSAFDTLLLGTSGCVSLYTAALLSRAGRKVLVLSPGEDASGCLTLKECGSSNPLPPKYKNVPFDVNASNIASISKQQRFLAPALCTTTDYQGGIRFAQVGSATDGHAFEILAIPGVGTESKNQDVPFVLRADGGARTLVEDAATYLGDGWPDPGADSFGNSTVGAYLQACESMNSTSSLFFLSKILSDRVNNLRKDPVFAECAVRPASGFLDKCFPLNAHTRSLMAGIGMRGENIKPSQASMAAHVSSVCSATNGEGMHYPIGGPRALSRALANVIEQHGGRIVTGIELKDLLFDEDPTVATRNVTKPDEGPPPPRCVGVQVSDGRQIRFASDRYDDKKSQPVPAVVCLRGFIDTFIRLLPEDIRTKYKVPKGLPALAEQRPVFKILFAIAGTASDLDITGADYYRLPNASIATDVFDSSSGTVVCGEIGGHDDHDDSATTEGGESDDIVATTNRDQRGIEATRTASSKRKKGHRVKFHTGESWLQISFPSAKDPSFASRHGSVTTCVVTVEADNDFVTPFDTNPKIFVINKKTAGTPQQKERLLDKVTKDLLEIYPQLDGKIDHAEVRGPFSRGLSHTPERFAAKGVRADTPYPRLFVGGSDLTVGESFGSAAVGGWLVANAVVGYKAVDHFLLKKNLTTDLDDFLEPPSLPDEEDLAVPYTLQSQSVAEPSVES